MVLVGRATNGEGMKVTNEEVGSAAKVLLALFRAIHESGPEGMPGGVLYANVMGFMSFQQYQNCIELMKQQKLIKESNHLLTSLVKPEELLKPGGRPQEPL